MELRHDPSVTQRLFLLIALAAAGAGLTGCFGEDETGVLLLDGTPGREAPVELEGVQGDTILTATTVIPVGSLEPGTFAHSCLEERSADTAAEGSAVVRVGVTSESVTVREAGGRALRGCSSSGRRDNDQSSCGSVHALLDSGRLRDPRLSVACTTTDGKPVGSAWIEVSERTRYVAVWQPGYLEVYEAAAGLPVRVATVTDVKLEGSATFDLSEHDAEGRLLRRDRVEMAVAG